MRLLTLLKGCLILSEIYKVSGIAIISVVCAIVLKKLGSSVTPYITQVAAVAIFVGAVTSLLPAIKLIRELIKGNSVEIGGVSTLFTATAIALISNIVGEICRENGENTLKNAVDFAANTEILLLSLPILTQIVTSVSEVLLL